MIQLGDRVKDIITGFIGRATGKAEYITGCTQFLIVTDKLGEKGELKEAHWFDDSRLIVVPKSKRIVLETLKKKLFGGPQSNPPDGNTIG